MKYYIEFPPSAKQFQGVHTFFSKASRNAFRIKAEKLGAAGWEQWDDRTFAKDRKEQKCKN